MDGEIEYGVILYCQNQFSEALRHFNNALMLCNGAADTAAVHSNIGNCFDRMGRYHEASLSYRQALMLRPLDARFPFNLGETLSKSLNILIACSLDNAGIAGQTLDISKIRYNLHSGTVMSDNNDTVVNGGDGNSSASANDVNMMTLDGSPSIAIVNLEQFIFQCFNRAIDLAVDNELYWQRLLLEFVNRKHFREALTFALRWQARFPTNELAAQSLTQINVHPMIKRLLSRAVADPNASVMHNPLKRKSAALLEDQTASESMLPTRQYPRME
jgi:tetratricopeptide (TPR) repeat protein